ncbi:MAG: hypothetical protein IJK04_02960 [Kiritimatiellae bacterium]|nr:hypothetical protein [Kiritimatiellia bacterium]
MKKITTLFAVGVVALGASAQADQVESTEYALITIPMVQGASAYNLVGISVNPIGDNPTLATVFGDSLNDTALVMESNSATAVEPDAVPAVQGNAVWIKNATVDYVYELGVAPAESGTATVATTTGGSLAMLATPFASTWDLSKLDLQKNGSSVLASGAGTNPRTADKVSIWQAGSNKYYDYVYIGTQWRAANKATPASLPTIRPGEGVFVKLCSSRTEGNTDVTISAPAAVAP